MPRRRRWWTPAHSCVLLVWAAKWHVAMYRTGHSSAFHDFGRFYYSAVYWTEGRPLYGSSPATPAPELGMELWNLNPPWLTLLFAPLAGLPVHVAVLCWWAFSALCLIAAGWLIVNELRPHWSVSIWLALIACSAAAVPTLSLTFTGHLTGPVGLLLTWVWREMRHDRISRAAIGIGVAIAIRLFFLPLAGYLVMTKQWRALCVTLLSVAACALVSLGVFGWSEHLAWVAVMRDVQWQFSPLNASITGMTSRFALSTTGAPTAAMKQATLVGLGISAAVGLFGVWRSSVSSAAFDTRWLLLLATSLIAFPVGWIYYFWILAGPLAASWSMPSVRRAIYLTLPAWFLPWNALRITPWAPVNAIILSIYCWGLLALWVVTVAEATEADRAVRPTHQTGR